MDRHLHRKHIPKCKENIPLVDQYMSDNKINAHGSCENGINHSIYNEHGHIHYTLPLEMYPNVNEIHPHIALSSSVKRHHS